MNRETCGADVHWESKSKLSVCVYVSVLIIASDKDPAWFETTI